MKVLFPKAGQCFFMYYRIQQCLFIGCTDWDYIVVFQQYFAHCNIFNIQQINHILFVNAYEEAGGQLLFQVL